MFEAAVRIVDNDGVYSEQKHTVNAMGSLAFTYGHPSSGDSAVAVLPLPDGDLFIAGVRDLTEEDTLVARLGTDLSEVFVRQWGGGGSDSIYDAVLAQDGFIYTCGSTNSFGEGLNDGLLQKWNADGELIWNRSYGQEDSSELFSALIVVDELVYAAGYQFLDGGKLLALAVSCSAINGELEWTRNVIAPGSANYADLDYRPAIDAAPARILACGTWSASAGQDDALYVELSLPGSVALSETWGEAASIERGFCLCRTDGETYIAGDLSNGAFLGKPGGQMIALSGDTFSVEFAADLDGHSLLLTTTQSLSNRACLVSFNSALELQPAIFSGSTTQSGLFAINEFPGPLMALCGSAFSLPAFPTEQLNLVSNSTSTQWTSVSASATRPDLVDQNIGTNTTSPTDFAFNQTGQEEITVSIGAF